jgi:S1-C subfamily serine protease
MVMMVAAVPAFAQNRVEMPRPGAVSMIGVRLGDMTADEAKTLKLPKAEGAVVEAVNPNSPASTAGLRAKDVIVEFDGERVRSARHLTRLVSETPVGRDVTVTVMRDGKKSEMHIKTEAGNWFNPQFSGIDPAQMRDFGQEIGRQAREMSRNIPDMVDSARAGVMARGRLGVSVQELSPELAEYFGVKSGVLVATVQKDSAAEKAGLKAGDVITAIDGHRLTSPAELIKALPTGDGSQDVNLTVTREKKELKVKATLEPATRQRAPARRGTPA